MALDELGIDWKAEAAQLEGKKPDVSSAKVVEDTVAEPKKEDRGFAEDVLVHGVLGGVEQAGRGLYSTVKAGAELAGAELPELGKPLISEAEGITGQITRDVTQFGLGFVGGLGLLKAAGVATKLAPVAKEMVASAIGTGVVADPTAARLSNLIQKYPHLENPITEYLAQDDTDGTLESKFKASLEDVATTPVALVLFKAIKGLKAAGKGDDVTAKQMGDELHADLNAASVSPDAPATGKALNLDPNLPSNV
ncbi:MAG: hypothetical protein ACRCYM_02685, partial [Cetobacterium sp.]